MIVDTNMEDISEIGLKNAGMNGDLFVGRLGRGWVDISIYPSWNLEPETGGDRGTLSGGNSNLLSGRKIISGVIGG